MIDAVTAMQDLPAALGVVDPPPQPRAPGAQPELARDGLKEHLDRTGNRLALALVALGLCTAGSLLARASMAIYCFWLGLPVPLPFGSRFVWGAIWQSGEF